MDKDYDMNNIDELRDIVGEHESQQPSEDDRRDIRRIHSRIRDDLISNKADVTCNDLQNILEKIEEHFDKISTTREAVKDAENIKLVSELQRHKIQSYKMATVPLSVEPFAENVISFCASALPGQADDSYLRPHLWNLLGQHCSKLYRKTTPLHFMCGTFDRGNAVRKVMRDRRQKDNEPLKTTNVTQLSTFEVQENEATTQEVDGILRLISSLYNEYRSPICYFELVLHPHSFGETMENIFYVSLLIKDGLVDFSLDEDGLPTLVPSQRETVNENNVNVDLHRQQCIICLTVAEWKELVLAFNIREPVINRASRMSSCQ